VLALGGIIAMTRAEDAGVVPQLAADEIVASMGSGIGDLALQYETVKNVSGANLQLDSIRTVAERITHARHQGCSDLLQRRA
jgi:L-asparaginase/Glu-tRNA(Gln) amidotransferase subunit D